MTIRNNNNTASTNEPNLIPAVPVYYDDDEFDSHQNQYYSAASGAPSGPVEPVSSAVALTTGQSYRYRREDQLQLQLITIPSSNVLADYSVPPQTTIQKDKLTTVRPVQVTAIIEPPNNCNSNNNSSNSSTDNSNGTYMRRHGMIINRKHAHLPEPILRFQQQRQQRTQMAAWTGGVVGLVVAGPLGAALGAGTAYATAKTVGKQREHRMTRQWRHHNNHNNHNNHHNHNNNVAWPVEQVIV